MELEKALRILNPATREAALADYAGDCHLQAAAVEEACRVVCAYARERMEAENNEPLTLEELRKMLGKPVLLTTGYIQYCEQIISNWEVLIGYVDDEFYFTRRARGFRCKDYGKTWIAYRRPLEEALPHG